MLILKITVLVLIRTIERLKTTNSSSKTTLMALDPKTHTSKRIVPMPGIHY